MINNIRKFPLLTLLLAFILVCAGNLSVWARGGGGCLIEGTSVNTPEGQISIENIKQGDTVIGWDGTKIVHTKVITVIKVPVDEYLELVTSQGIINVTSEHPLFISSIELKRAQDIEVGNRLRAVINNESVLIPVLSIKTIQARCFVYNLIVESPATFLANGFVVHNKGCFLPDTEILLADGSKISISQVKVGDKLLAYTLDGEIVSAPVYEVITAKCDKYYEITTDSAVIKVTAEHPLYVGDKIFRLIEAVNLGDYIFVFDGKQLSKEIVRSKHLIDSSCIVYNLRTDYPNTFFANMVAVHNKGGGGCFPAGTQITTPSGNKSIESIKIGDTVSGVDTDNRIIPVKVLKIYSTTSELIQINTESGIIRTTRGHPFLKANTEFSSAGTLQNGDKVLAFYRDMIQSVKILSVTKIPGPVLVFNIEVGFPHTFIADNMVVHNKGGGGGFGGGYHGSGGHGGGGSSSSSGGGGGDGFAFAVFIFIVIIIVFVVLASRKQGGENLDFCYPKSQVQKKAEKTGKLIAFLSTQDSSVGPELLRKTARDTFLKLQECWQSRDYAPMKQLMMSDLYGQHLQQIGSMKSDHEINIIGGLTVNFVEIVLVRYYEKKTIREFTALIEASARDYYVDDQSREFIRGDNYPATFQEFWTFQYNGTNWLLRDVEQTKESDALSDRNFVEMFTDEQLRQIYGEPVSKDTGPVGPWTDKDVKTRDDRIHRHLNFLVQTDKIWNESDMKETVRNVFISYHVARESANTENIRYFLLPDILNSLQTGIDIRKKRGESVEFRNLCVRKVDIILIRNFTDNSKDEFTARITAHAQKILKENGQIVKQDEDVVLFEQYWTFGRRDNKWLLKEILPSARSIMGKANIDEDASKDQIEWYYTKDRAL